jgi:hypothetical protein
MNKILWTAWLKEWNDELLQALDLSKYNAFIEPDITPESIASGWLGAPPATEQQIRQLEHRLGETLPPSYRSFLECSNGFRQPGNIVPRILSVDQVEWHCTHNQWAIDAWMEGVNHAGPPEPVSDEEYFLYGDEQTIAMRHEYLQTALEVSATETVGDGIYLLNRQIRTDEGEWEAWYFASWIPGAARYRSFWELMQSERESFNLRD